MKKKMVVILGPTASGKTRLAIDLAKEFNGEIICADSRQVYRKMDIATAKPSEEEKIAVPHHLFDVVDPGKEFNAAIYKRLAQKSIENVHKRKKIPFLVGGTGMYIWAVIDNLTLTETFPDKKLRKKLLEKDVKELFSLYKKLDPEGVREIDSKNKRRLIRAIEVCKSTGQPFWKQRKKESPLFDILQIGIEAPGERLKERIEKRAEKMFETGLEQEVKILVKKYGWLPLAQTIGYQEWKGYFEGEKTIEKVKEEIVLHTTQYAKRQMTWFKRDRRIIWIKNKKQAQNLIRKFLKD